jgi:RNA polymerase-binding transcription factor DksA
LADSILAGACPFGEHDGYVSESIDKDLSLEHKEEDLCQAIDDALVRLKDGTFGSCVHCGREIGMRRLEVLPFTSRCIKCEHEWERERVQARGGVATL